MHTSAFKINKIEESVMVGLNCLEHGLDSKAAVKKRILEAVYKNCFVLQDLHKVEDLPGEVFRVLQKQLGLHFETNNGKIIGLNFKSPEGKRVVVTIIDNEGGKELWQEPESKTSQS